MIGIHRIVASLLVFISLANTWLVPLIYLDFELRKEYIAKVLCIERDKPITVCGGSCYITKQLEKVSEQQEKEEKTNTPLFVFFFQKVPSVLIDLSPGKLSELDYLAYQEPLYSEPYLSGVYHPPSS